MSRRTINFHVRLTAEEREKLDMLAEQFGMQPSTLLRMLLLQAGDQKIVTIHRKKSEKVEAEYA